MLSTTTIKTIFSIPYIFKVSVTSEQLQLIFAVTESTAFLSYTSQITNNTQPLIWSEIFFKWFPQDYGGAQCDTKSQSTVFFYSLIL